jgi:translocation and assembly module TamA
MTDPCALCRPFRIGPSASALTALTALAALGVPAAAERVELRWDEQAGVSEALKAEIKSKLTDETRPETRFEARRQADRAAKSARDALNARAYFDPALRAGVEAVGDSGFVAFVELAPGPRFKIGTIDLTFAEPPPRAPDQAAAKALITLAPGDYAIPGPIIENELALVQGLRELGYADADTLARETLGRRKAARIDVIYAVKSGPRVRLGNVLYTGDSRTRDSFLLRLVPYEVGAVYAPQTLTQFSARLNEARLFERARVTLSETPSAITEEGDEVRDVLVMLDDLPRNRVGFGFRLETDTGFGLTADILRRNLTRRGDFLEASLDLAAPFQTLDLLWRRPHVNRYGRGMQVSASAENAKTDAFDRRLFGLSASYDIIHDPHFSYGYGVSGAFSSEQDAFTRIAFATGRRDVQTASGFASANWDFSDNLLNPKTGWRAELYAQPTYSFGDASALYLKALGEVRAYRTVSPDRGLVAAGRLRLGSVFGAKVSDIPTDQRFYAGGGGSVRGFAYQEVGPQAGDGTYTGGRSLIEAVAEMRWQQSARLGWAVFVDAGAVSENDFPKADNLRVGAGVGARYMTPAGPLRFDIATPLDRRDGESPVQVYISLGQAF